MSPPAIPEARLRVRGQTLRLTAPQSGSGAWRGSVFVDGQAQPGRLMSHQRLLRGGDVGYEEAPLDERGPLSGN
jgi:hypothetical protein